MYMYEDYLRLLSPPEAVKHEIARYKKASAKLIGNYKSMDSPAHISVQHLERQKPFMAETNVSKLENSLNELPPILLHVDGFKYFTHLHSKMTIYAHIRITPAVDDWFTLLKKKLHIKKTIIPHITIVRDIPEKDFNLLWPHFKHKKLVEPFWVNELKMLKRESFAPSPQWLPFKVFEFKNLKDMANSAESIINRQAAAENQINLF
ncbi:2'-5' RNA ligase family protein [Mucilaginibacter aquaedulcis]|uniref:2'-5' RNA ligase family protein n=1 Tax=Mucilaginibacter aquaedulcis TaxID=1187081 RepID=UPI0025B59F70|nr:2'-5' RNA ligase family protein [Mucilaginibacter aquaedulcis]MDN3548299.1 2'-5' RNA ligase family protein [Mucilaginibacter aquaedulcis]